MVMTVNIDKLNIDSDGLKVIDDINKYKLKTSIKLHGQLRNILVDDDMNVVEGRRIAIYMKELGHKEIDVQFVKSDPKEQLICRLCLNNEFSDFDFVKVSKYLSEVINLNDRKFLYEILPFTNDDIDDYIDYLEFSFDQFSKNKLEQGNLFK